MLFFSHKTLRFLGQYGWLWAAVAMHGTTMGASSDTKRNTATKSHDKSRHTHKKKHSKKGAHKVSKSKAAQDKKLYIILGSLLSCMIVGYVLLGDQGHDGNDDKDQDDTHDDKDKHGSDASDGDKPLQDTPDSTGKTNVQKPSTSHVFADFECGAAEIEYEKGLGPLEEVPLAQCVLNPDVLKANVHANVDLLKYPTTFKKTQEKILDLFGKARLPNNITFANGRDKDDTRRYGKEKTLQDLQYFAEDMQTNPNKLRLTDQTKRMLNYVIDQLHQLDMGQPHQEDGDLTPTQRANRLLVRKILPDIPVIQAECHASTVSFVNQAGAMIQLNTLGTTTFTGSVLAYLQVQLAKNLESAIDRFIPMRRAKVRQKSFHITQKIYWKATNQQHIVNGLKAGCQPYMRTFPGDDTVDQPYNFTGDAEKYKENAPDAITQDEFVKLFMQYFQDNYLTPQDILHKVRNAIIYSGIPAKYYIAFAKQKGVKDEDILDKDGMPNPKVLGNLLLNIKVFQRKEG